MRKNQSQLNGFWGWVKRHVHSIAAVCTAVGLVAVGAALETIVAADGGPGQDENGNTYSGWRTYEPTGSEKVILDNWVDTKFKPYYQTLLNNVNSVFNSQNFTDQLNVINSVIRKMTIISNYYSLNNPESLSQNGVDIRLELVELTFTPLRNLIANALQSNANQIELSAFDINMINANEFESLGIPSSNVNYPGEKYIVIGSVSSSPVTAGINLNSSTAVIAPNPTVPQTIVTTTPSTTTNNSSSGSSPLVKVAFVVAAYFGLKYIFSDSKKDTKNSKKQKVES